MSFMKLRKIKKKIVERCVASVYLFLNYGP